MVGQVGKAVAGIFFLIAVFLFLTRAGETATIISAFANASTSGIRALQGKD